MLQLPSLPATEKNVGLAVVLKYTILSTVPEQAEPHFLFAKCTEAFVPTAFNFNLTEIHGQKLFSFSVCSIGAVSQVLKQELEGMLIFKPLLSLIQRL